MSKPTWLHTKKVSDLFAPLPPVRWLVQGLHIAPGAPTLVMGYGWSGKSVFLQTLMLCIASGTPFLGHPVRRGRVLHMDYEQGFRLTSERYQRIAKGLGIDYRLIGDNLQACILPERGLDTLTDLRDACDGFDLCSVDAWRGAHPSVDENSSAVRVTLDRMTRASEETGCVWMPLQHTGKPRKDPSGKAAAVDGRTAARGSSSFFDGAQCVIMLDGTVQYRPVLSLHKTRFGVLPTDMQLEVVDTDGGGLVMRPLAVQEPAKKPGRPKRDLRADLFALVLKQPGLSKVKLRDELGCNKESLDNALQELMEDGKVKNDGGGWYAFLVKVKDSSEV